MSRVPGLIKKERTWKTKDGATHSGWSYATRVRARGTERLFAHGTQDYGDALTKHHRVLDELEEVTVEVASQRTPDSRRFTWVKSAKVADVAREAAAALGCEGSDPGLQFGGTMLEDDGRLVDARLRDGDRLLLVTRLTVDAAHERWREADLANRRNERGQRETVARYMRHVSPVVGSKRLDLLTGADVLALRRHLDASRVAGQARVLRPETVRHTLSDLRAFLGWAADQTGGSLISSVPWPRKVMPRVPERRPKPLALAELDAVLAVGEPHARVIRLGLATGLRWGDLCRVQARDLKRGASGWYLEVAVGKTGKVLRVPVTDSAVVHEVRGSVGRLVPFGEASAGSFNKAIRRRTGVASFHVHRLRHTFATEYLASGGSLPALQSILGHSSIKTTERYARLLHEHVMEDARRVATRREHGDHRGDQKEAAV